MTKRSAIIRMLAVLLALTAAGCADYVIVNGKKYEAIGETEERELVYRARLALYKNTKIVPPEDYQFAASHEPELDVRYLGDRAGVAKLVWKMPKRKYIVVFEGVLGTDRMTCVLQVEDVQPEVLDLSGR